MLNYIERGHEIKRAVLVRQLFTRGESNLVESTLPTKRQRIFRDINSLRLAVLRKHQQVRSRTATDVENSRTSIINLPANLFHESSEDLAAPGIPPVRLLNAEHNWICVFLHPI